jgi:hypothetical protein
MKHAFPISAFAGSLCLAMLAGNCAPAQPTGRAVLPELAGRTSGKPQRCVPASHSASLRIADPQTVVYGSGGTIWVNRLASNCLRTGPMDILVVEPIGTQYCRGDRIHSVDPVSKIPGPYCLLGDFVPYRH